METGYQSNIFVSESLRLLVKLVVELPDFLFRHLFLEELSLYSSGKI